MKYVQKMFSILVVLGVWNNYLYRVFLQAVQGNVDVKIEQNVFKDRNYRVDWIKGSKQRVD